MDRHMKHLKKYKSYESSEFVDYNYIDELLDKISDSGIESLSDIENNRSKLFSEGDKEIIETIEKMADITREFKELNKKMCDISNKGGNTKNLMKDWMELNKKLVPLESSFRKWGIELGDERLDRLMRKTRPDAYNIFESVNKNDLTTFIFDFGIFITLNLSQVTKMGIDENGTKELVSMMSNLREPLINGKSYKELTTDINYLIQNPKLLSALLDQIRKLLIYIEPRIIKFVKEDEFKSNWLSKIKNFKDRYIIIIK